MSRGRDEVARRNGHSAMPVRRVLIDAGPLVALLNVRDPQHDLCNRTVQRIDPPLLTCWPPLVEASYLLRADRRATERMMAMLQSDMIQLLTLGVDDLPGISGYLDRYADRGLQLADACLAHVAEREGLTTLFTLDRRDFAGLVLGDGRTLALLPDAGG